MLIACNECGFKFSFDELELKEQIIKIKDKEVRIEFFICPKCDNIYIYNCNNYITDRLLDDIKDLNRKYSLALENKDLRLADKLSYIRNCKQVELSKQSKILLDYCNNIVYENGNIRYLKKRGN